MVEGESPYDFVGEVELPQGLLHGSGLGVGAVQNRKIAIAKLLVIFLLKNGVRDDSPLLVIGSCFKKLDEVTFRIGGPDHLFELGLVLVNDGIGRFDNGLGGAVVLLQLDHK